LTIVPIFGDFEGKKNLLSEQFKFYFILFYSF